MMGPLDRCTQATTWLLRSPRRCTWLHRCHILEAVLALMLCILNVVILLTEHGFESVPKVAGYMFEALLFSCIMLARLPWLCRLERRSALAARLCEEGRPGASLLSAKIMHMAILDMLVVSVLSFVLFLTGVVHFWRKSLCPRPEDGAWPFACHFYYMTCCLFMARNVVFGALCFLLMAALEPHLRERIEELSSKGLEPEAIEQLPAHPYGDPRAPATDTQCTICLEEFARDEMVRYLPCGHHFHAACADAWLRRRAECPMRCESGLGGTDEGAVGLAQLDLADYLRSHA